jgi:hypothetical protein
VLAQQPAEAGDQRRARELLRIGVDHDPGNRVRFRLAGGGKRIRTHGPAGSPGRNWGQSKFATMTLPVAGSQETRR